MGELSEYFDVVERMIGREKPKTFGEKLLQPPTAREVIILTLAAAGLGIAAGYKWGSKAKETIGALRETTNQRLGVMVSGGAETFNKVKEAIPVGAESVKRFKNSVLAQAGADNGERDEIETQRIAGP